MEEKKQTKIPGPKPKILEPPVYIRPRNRFTPGKTEEADKLAALDIISRDESAAYEQRKLFVPNQQNLFPKKKGR